MSKSCVCFWWFYAVASCRALLQTAEVNPGLSLIIGSSANNCLSLYEKMGRKTILQPYTGQRLSKLGPFGAAVSMAAASRELTSFPEVNGRELLQQLIDWSVWRNRGDLAVRVWRNRGDPAVRASHNTGKTRVVFERMTR